MWIENVSYRDIQKGDHMPSNNAILIQICDPLHPFPTSPHKFVEMHRYEFLDLEATDTWGDEFKITPYQAADLVENLQSALDRNLNVVVHCHAGVCRSGAVAEVGVMMGFEDMKRFRSPNLMVKHAMMRVLGWTYDEQEPHTINGKEFIEVC